MSAEYALDQLPSCQQDECAALSNANACVGVVGYVAGVLRSLVRTWLCMVARLAGVSGACERATDARH